VQVSAVPAGGGQLQVTVSIAGDTLQRLDFVNDARIANPNALIDAPAPAVPTLSGATAPTGVALPPGTASYTFFIRRATAGVATTQAFTVQLGSGRIVPKFVGGGPAAF
jgi:hypothetical protein